MRSLAQTDVLVGAATAALLTSLACYPRLYLWPARPGPLLFVCLLLLWATFVLWSFVLGWHNKYTGQRVLVLPRQPGLWAIATLWGVAMSVLLRLLIDPKLRLITPNQYPNDWQSWVVMSLFTLSFEPLFLCFAPFAFFARLFQRRSAATALTVSFGIFVLYLKLRTWPRLPAGLVAEWLILQSIAGFLVVYFYLRGGVWLVWWLGLLSELRHLLAFA